MPTIYCIGKNYAAHAKEMGSTADATGEPVVFLKPESAIAPPPGPIRIPPGAGEIHHEAEIVVRVGSDVGGGAAAEAIALGLDLTDRTRQAKAKKEGMPWATAKGFKTSACVGPFVRVADLPPLDRLHFTLAVNGVVRQSGDSSLMLRSIPRVLAEIDRWFGLRSGDLVYTGTPEGVGPIAPGDVLDLALEGVPAVACRFLVAR